VLFVLAAVLLTVTLGFDEFEAFVTSGTFGIITTKGGVMFEEFDSFEGAIGAGTLTIVVFVIF